MNKIGINSSSFKDRTGEKYITNKGYKIEIIEYNFSSEQEKLKQQITEILK